MTKQAWSIKDKFYSKKISLYQELRMTCLIGEPWKKGNCVCNTIKPGDWVVCFDCLLLLFATPSPTLSKSYIIVSLLCATFFTHGNKADNLKQAKWGSQSEHRISFIFPMSTASDVLKRVSKADIFSVCIALEHPFDEGVILKTLFKLFTGVVYLSTQLIKPYYLVIPLNPPSPMVHHLSFFRNWPPPPPLLDKWSYNY